MRYVVYGLAIVGGIVLLVSVVNLVSNLFGSSGRRPRRIGLMRTRSALCLRCHGTGWLQAPERTLTFTGEGFADIHQPAEMCAACGGTGRVRRGAA